ncbi:MULTISPECIES: hypothetical protein [unclassified Marinitoga]|uniref:hypothetical protein n=1 Tax=unclassified Marinitoga TaxID=2640159 RepID=UPI0009505C8B|nr:MULTISPECIES: hypothetical protein [unclassified Marinitoga]APT75442.1 hypothetical protein LN42_02840 [Marinitoga sp. 1137]NUU97101.1 hypothetical protein [Marinitoga sp. 1138]
MGWWKSRRIYLFLLVIFLFLFNFIIFKKDSITIINLNPFETIEFFNGKDFTEYNFGIKRIKIDEIMLINFQKNYTIHIPIKINTDFEVRYTNKLYIAYSIPENKILLDNTKIYYEDNFDVSYITEGIIFLKSVNIELPEELYIFNNEYAQSFFLYPNYIFLRNIDFKNGIFVHELSHYVFGYKIQKKKKNDIWPELIAEAIRLNYLKSTNRNLYKKVIEDKAKNADIYSKVLDYPILVNNIYQFISTFKEQYYNKKMSDDEFFSLLDKYRKEME